MEEDLAIRTEKEAAQEALFQPAFVPLFKAAFKKYLPVATTLQLLRLAQRYHAFFKATALPFERQLTLQTLYWQELFLSWQDFGRAQQEAAATDQGALNQALLAWIKGYYFIHLRHLETLFTFYKPNPSPWLDALSTCKKAMTAICASLENKTLYGDLWLLRMEAACDAFLHVLSRKPPFVF